jgi:porphobilinogen deaminase
LPDPLIRIQFRRVGWEALQMDYFCPAIGQEVFDLRCTMDTGAVPNHQQLAVEIPLQMPQEGYAIQACQGTCARPCGQLSSRRNAAHH